MCVWDSVCVCVSGDREREREREGREGGREGGRDLALNSNKNSPGNDLLIQVNATHLDSKVCSVHLGEPSLTTSLLGKQGVQGARALDRCGSSVPQQHSASKVCSVLPHAFGVVRLYRTFSNDSFPGETRVQGAFCAAV